MENLRALEYKIELLPPARWYGYLALDRHEIIARTVDKIEDAKSREFNKAQQSSTS